MTMLSDLKSLITTLAPTETTIAEIREPPHDPTDPHTAPAAVLTLYSTGGPQASSDFSGGTFAPRTAQLRVRDPLAGGCERRTEALYALFVAVRAYPQFPRIVASSAPTYVYPPDANGNSIGSFNLSLVWSG